MLKRFLIVFILLLSSTQFVYAKDIPIQIESPVKISTSNLNLKEGDCLNFVVTKDIYDGSKLYIKKGTQVSGIITSLTDNGFTCQEASIYAEQFRTKTKNGEVIKLKGVVYKKGRTHWMFTQFIPIIYVFIRGGEAQIMPKVDYFILYAEVGND